jgi:hypothetical protein
MQPDDTQPAHLMRETSPTSDFETPEKLLADMSIEPDTKATLLQQWASDLQDRLRASDESMPGSPSGQAGDLLRRVKSAQLQLHAE